MPDVVVTSFVVLLVAMLPVAALLLPKFMRVAQREHYIAGWVSRVTLGWYRNRPNAWLPILVAVVLGAVLGVYLVQDFDEREFTFLFFSPVIVAGAAIIATFAPAGLKIRGTSAPLRWTARTRRLAIAWVPLWLSVASVLTCGVLWMVNAVVFSVFTRGEITEATTEFLFWLILESVVVGAVVAVIATPLITDLTLWVMKPVEKALSRKWLVALNPTKASGKRMREGYHEAMRQTIEYLYALPEIEPPRCGYCGDVITRTDKRARFCSRYCQRENGKRTRIARMKGLKL